MLAHPDSSPFQRPAWVLAAAEATDNPAHILAARGPCGTLRGMLALNLVRSRIFGRALVSSAFAVDGGILAHSAHAVKALGQAGWKLARKLRCPTAEFRGGPVPGEDWHSHDDRHVGFARPLAADEDAELLAIPRKHRAELRKALANDRLRAVHGVDDALVHDHYRVYSESVRNLGTPVFPRALFRRMLARFGKDADVTVVYDGDRPVSTALSLYHHDAVMPIWGGGVHDARRLRSNELLYFRLMAHARERGCRLFDFGRSKVDSGQAAWKRSWGFEPVSLCYHTRSDGDILRDINPNSGRYRLQVRIWKRLPLPVANLIGPHVARGLG